MYSKLFKATLFVFFLIGFTSNINAQKAHEIADEQILALKEGVLLVRLNESNKKIDWLRNADKNAEAEKIEKEEAEMNSKIIEAFAESYDFSAYYFFYSKHAGEIKNGQFANHLLDAQGQSVSSNVLEGKAYYVAEYGFIKNDAGNERAAGLRIMDNEYNQLSPPFPYGELSQIFIFTRPMTNIVKKFNNRLVRYFKDAEIRMLRRGYKTQFKEETSGMD